MLRGRLYPRVVCKMEEELLQEDSGKMALKKSQMKIWNENAGKVVSFTTYEDM